MINNLTTSKKGAIELAGHEGISLTKYKDSVGVWTIGIGATKSEIPDLDSWSLNKALTLEEVITLFKTGLKKYEDAVNKAVRVPLSQTQFDALVSICYNIGIAGLSGSTFVKLINSEAPLNDIKAAIMRWTKQKELVTRRLKEANLFCYGLYSNEGKVTVFPVNNVGKPIYSKGQLTKLSL